MGAYAPVQHPPPRAPGSPEPDADVHRGASRQHSDDAALDAGHLSLCARYPRPPSELRDLPPRRRGGLSAVPSRPGDRPRRGRLRHRSGPHLRRVRDVAALERRLLATRQLRRGDRAGHGPGPRRLHPAAHALASPAVRHGAAVPSPPRRIPPAGGASRATARALGAARAFVRCELLGRAGLAIPFALALVSLQTPLTAPP